MPTAGEAGRIRQTHDAFVLLHGCQDEPLGAGTDQVTRFYWIDLKAQLFGHFGTAVASRYRMVVQRFPAKHRPIGRCFGSLFEITSGTSMDASDRRRYVHAYAYAYATIVEAPMLDFGSPSLDD